MSSVCSVDKKNFRATLHHSHISTQQNSVQGNCFIHLTTKFTRQPRNYRSLLVDFSFVSRCAFVRYSLADRGHNEYRTRKQRNDNEKTTRRRREQIETGTRSKQNKLQTTITNYYTRFWPFTWRVLQINPSGSTP